MDLMVARRAQRSFSPYLSEPFWAPSFYFCLALGGTPGVPCHRDDIQPPPTGSGNHNVGHVCSLFVLLPD